MKNISKIIKRIVRPLALSLAFVIMTGSVAYASDINITLVDASKDGLKISDNNFFAAFNGIVPGETKRQDLIFTNTFGQNATFYVWSEAMELGSLQRELMEKLTLKLKNGDRVLYTCNLAEVIQRKDLCTLKKNQSTVISMYMTMPEDIDNTYAGQTINAKWYVGVDVKDDDSGGGSGGSGSGGGGSHSGGGSSGGPGKETLPTVIETVPAETIPETDPVRPTDPYGNEIETTADNTGGEDTAGNEDNSSEETGRIDVIADIDPNLVDGKDIVLILEDENGKQHHVYLYAQNGFEASVLLPAGVYKVIKAFVVGDEEGLLYPLVVKEGYITIGSTGISSITISMGEAGAQMNVELTEHVNVEANKTQSNSLLYVILIGGLFIIILIIFIILKRKNNKEDDYNDD